MFARRYAAPRGGNFVRFLTVIAILFTAALTASLSAEASVVAPDATVLQASGSDADGFRLFGLPGGIVIWACLGIVALAAGLFTVNRERHLMADRKDAAAPARIGMV